MIATPFWPRNSLRACTSVRRVVSNDFHSAIAGALVPSGRIGTNGEVGTKIGERRVEGRAHVLPALAYPYVTSKAYLYLATVAGVAIVAGLFYRRGPSPPSGATLSSSRGPSTSRRSSSRPSPAS